SLSEPAAAEADCHPGVTFCTFTAFLSCGWSGATACFAFSSFCDCSRTLPTVCLIFSEYCGRSFTKAATPTYERYVNPPAPAVHAILTHGRDRICVWWRRCSLLAPSPCLSCFGRDCVGTVRALVPGPPFGHYFQSGILRTRLTPVFSHTACRMRPYNCGVSKSA